MENGNFVHKIVCNYCIFFLYVQVGKYKPISLLHRYEDFQFKSYNGSSTYDNITIMIIGEDVSEASLETHPHCLQSGSRIDRGDGVWRYFCTIHWI